MVGRFGWCICLASTSRLRCVCLLYCAGWAVAVGNRRHYAWCIWSSVGLEDAKRKCAEKGVSRVWTRLLFTRCFHGAVCGFVCDDDRCGNYYRLTAYFVLATERESEVMSSNRRAYGRRYGERGFRCLTLLVLASGWDFLYGKNSSMETDVLNYNQY